MKVEVRELAKGIGWRGLPGLDKSRHEAPSLSTLLSVVDALHKVTSMLRLSEKGDIYTRQHNELPGLPLPKTLACSMGSAISKGPT